MAPKSLRQAIYDVSVKVDAPYLRVKLIELSERAGELEAERLRLSAQVRSQRHALKLRAQVHREMRARLEARS